MPFPSRLKQIILNMEQFNEGLNKDEFNALKQKGSYSGPGKFTYTTKEEDESPRSLEAIFYKSLLILFALAFLSRIIFYYGDKLWKH